MTEDECFTYVDIAKLVELDSRTAYKYLYYMVSRWGDHEKSQCKSGYAKEWALRFKYGIEFEKSDSEGQKILNNIMSYRR